MHISTLTTQVFAETLFFEEGLNSNALTISRLLSRKLAQEVSDARWFLVFVFSFVFCFFLSQNRLP